MEENEHYGSLISADALERRIFIIRGQKVILSMHLADLYGVAPRALVQSVRRNKKRFPSDFMFQLNVEEFEVLKSQFVTSKQGGIRRALPYAFTEQGIAMLSSVLKSERAIAVNIAIMRVFAQLRNLFLNHADLLRRLDALEKEQRQQGQQVKVIFEAIRKLIEAPVEEVDSEDGRFGFGIDK